ncbi:MAG: hypothetical protein ACI4UE_04545 [Candidatus Scatovivens sp.]
MCSPIKRTKETCEYININKIQVKYDDRLMERDSKSLMYKPISMLDKSIWYDITQDIIYGDNEGFKSVITRSKICQFNNNGEFNENLIYTIL